MGTHLQTVVIFCLLYRRIEHTVTATRVISQPPSAIKPTLNSISITGEISQAKIGTVLLQAYSVHLSVLPDKYLSSVKPASSLSLPPNLSKSLVKLIATRVASFDPEFTKNGIDQPGFAEILNVHAMMIGLRESLIRGLVMLGSDRDKNKKAVDVTFIQKMVSSVLARDAVGALALWEAFYEGEADLLDSV